MVMLCCCGVGRMILVGLVGDDDLDVVFVGRGLDAFGVVEVGPATPSGVVDSSVCRRARA